MKPDADTKILLVEDASTMRKMEIKILKQLGYQNIIEAVDGRDALEKLGEEKGIQLIISDWAMPNMDGLELLKSVRSEEAYKHIPFIMATGQGDKEYVAMALEAGANGVVAKPFTPEDLGTQIKEAFGIKVEPEETGERLPRVDEEGKVRLRIAHIQITDHLTLGIMKDMIETGQKNPDHFALETLCMPGWNPVQRALEKGNVDAAFILAPTAMDLFNYGVPLRLIMFTHRNGSILVRTRSQEYRKPFQQFFKHKTFFIPHKMSIHNMLAHMYFTQMGLKPGLAGKEAVNVLFDVVPPVKMPEFLSENPQSCGFMVAEPIGSRAIAAGIAERQILSSELWDNHPCCVAVFREEFMGKYPDAVHEFSHMLVEAGRFIGENPDRASEIAVKFLDPDGQLGLKSSLLKSVLTDPKGIRTDNLFPVLEDLDAIQRYMTQKMGIGRIIDLESFVDTRFAEEAHKDLPAPSRTIGPMDKPELTYSIQGDADGEERETPAPLDRFQAVQAEQPTISREGKYLTFGIGDERYGIGILDVREIIGMMPIRPIPQMPEHMKGVINLRGKVIPVIDLRLKFSMEPLDYTDRTCIIVVEVAGLTGSSLMGIVVDKVWEVTEIKEEEVEDAPSFGRSVNTGYILGLAKRSEGVTILLDIDELLQREGTVELANVA
ncbi:MAG: chemotaxis protein CheW [Deltaproteobacteria bacterium]|nr:chemotaxis protein CheW [Deltaproteobacteria bacterium]MBW2017276.1 chemotaxis protein CheW [Deltaproteobacteria bacterium]MBW2128125.1 chemotaxis protein CheW [Deltaproteobacteria bacterium]MBW2304794.1 chemotaxis protein CheW [Deltaproteobacteria bacterium]